VAAQWGITCKMSDHCRCLDCQVSNASMKTVPTVAMKCRYSEGPSKTGSIPAVLPTDYEYVTRQCCYNDSLLVRILKASAWSSFHYLSCLRNVFSFPYFKRYSTMFDIDIDRLCGLAPGYRSRGPRSIPGVNRS
jgi:hypothetical protein